MINISKVILLPVALLVIFFQPLLSVKASDDAQAEQIIQDYIDYLELDIQPGTLDYKIFLRNVFWGNYPDLTGTDSVFLTNPAEIDYIVNYAWKYSGYQEIYNSYNLSDVNIGEAQSVPNQSLSQETDIMFSPSEGRAQAISYAYQWSASGLAIRNPAYPDFELVDCTNFISQAMIAGRFLERGSGDGCKYEDTITEWYVEPNPSPSIFCLGDNRDWEWSTSWSLVDPFRYYFAYENHYAISHGWTTSASLAKYYLSPGDVVQIQYDDNDTWVGFHTMIVTSEDATDLYMTYHSNADGLDEVDRPLSSITLQANWRFVLVEIRYPWQVFLPAIFSIGVQTDAIQLSNPYPVPLEHQPPSESPYPSPP